MKKTLETLILMEEKRFCSTIACVNPPVSIILYHPKPTPTIDRSSKLLTMNERETERQLFVALQKKVRERERERDTKRSVDTFTILPYHTISLDRIIAVF